VQHDGPPGAIGHRARHDPKQTHQPITTTVQARDRPVANHRNPRSRVPVTRFARDVGRASLQAATMKQL